VFNIYTLFTFKYPLQNQYNTRVSNNWQSSILEVKLAIDLCPLLFNPTIVNEKATDK